VSHLGTLIVHLRENLGIIISVNALYLEKKRKAKGLSNFQGQWGIYWGATAGLILHS